MAIRVSGNVSIPGGTVKIGQSGPPILENSPFYAQVLALSPIYYYPGNETSGNLQERVTGGPLLEAIPSPAADSNRPDIFTAAPGAVTGTTSGFYVTNDDLVGIATQDVTFIFAIRPSTSQPLATLFHVGELGISTEWGYFIYFNNNQLGVGTFDGGFGFATNTLNTLTAGQEYFIAIRWVTGVGVEFFIDGSSVQTVPLAQDKNTPASIRNLTIGAQQSNGESRFNNHEIAHFAEFPYLLSNGEITTLYNLISA